MQKLVYRLAKEDYLNWIHWNVRRRNLKKVQRITLIVYAAFWIFYMGMNIAAKKEPASLISTGIMMLILGGIMCYAVSARHQERVIWKRSGLQKLEKKDGFPTVELTLEETGIIVKVPDQESKEFSYADISEIREIERLFLLAASDQSWHFVAKSAFDSQEEMEAFKTWMEEKIEDAKEHPEKYKKSEKIEESSDSEEKIEMISGLEEEVEIEPVDTQNMGKVGKMAHIMAAMKAENESEEKEDAGEHTPD